MDDSAVHTIKFPIRFRDNVQKGNNALGLALREISDLQNALVRYDQNFKLEMLKTLMAEDSSRDRFEVMKNIDFMNEPSPLWSASQLETWEKYWGTSTEGAGRPPSEESRSKRIFISEGQFLSTKSSGLYQEGVRYVQETGASLSSTQVNQILQITLNQYLTGKGKKVQALAFGNASYPTFSPVRTNLDLSADSVKLKYETWEIEYTLSDESLPKKKKIHAFTMDLKIGYQSFPAYIEVKEDFESDPYCLQLLKLSRSELTAGGSKITRNSSGKIHIHIPIKTPVKSSKVVSNKFFGLDLGERNTITGVIQFPNEKLSAKPIRFGEEKEFQSLRTMLNAQMRRKSSARQSKRETYSIHAQEKVTNLIRLTARRLINYCVRQGFEKVYYEKLTGKKLWKSVPVGALITQIENVAKAEGVSLVSVDPKGTSLICSVCGKRPPKADLKKYSSFFYPGSKEKKLIPFGRYREFFVCSNPSCSEFNQLHDADFNASKNILYRGLEKTL